MACSLEMLRECFLPLRGINLSNTGLLFPHIEDARLEDLCGNFGNIKGCIDESIGQCDSQQKVKLSYKTDTLEYLCTTGYEDYKLVRPCYEDKELLTKVEHCNATFTYNMAQVSAIDEPISTKKEYLCSHMKDLVDCVRDSTREICNDKAADWIYNVKNTMLRSTLSEIGCPKKDQLPTILAVSFAVFVAFIIILLAFIFIYRRIKNEEELTKFNKDKSLCKTSMKSTSVRNIKSSEDVAMNHCKSDFKPHEQKQPQQQQVLELQKLTSRGDRSQKPGDVGIAENGGRLLLDSKRRGRESDNVNRGETTGVTVALLEDCERVAEDLV